MKTIHSINKWSFIITLVLYITVFGGLIAQILLGCIQVILALSLFKFWPKLNTRSRELLLIYWSFCISYLLIYLLLRNHMNDLWPLFYIIIPMSIAGYLVHVTFEIKKNSDEFQLDNL